MIVGARVLLLILWKSVFLNTANDCISVWNMPSHLNMVSSGPKNQTRDESLEATVHKVVAACPLKPAVCGVFFLSCAGTFTVSVLKGWGGHWHFSAMSLLKSLLDTHLNKLAELTLSGGLSRSMIKLYWPHNICGHLLKSESCISCMSSSLNYFGPIPYYIYPKTDFRPGPPYREKSMTKHCCLSWMNQRRISVKSHTVGIVFMCLSIKGSETSNWLNQQTE